MDEKRKLRKDAPEGLEEEFTFLDDLRDSGITNMWGAAPFLVRRFGIRLEEADKILVAWINSFRK